ncbi:MAG: amidohydrolase family protein [Sphingopyxis sp.]|uniref:amidohydrolase family protein n=1 Tax=Sphingopyxis sp. TaxID=1908224 RepID=UPI002ABAEB8F|nr:amidohydrolase family protein [Sphingopyxis sp.]MDZ3832262.1 amidohydrolase family protein [Sphingopyxis sp.]
MRRLTALFPLLLAAAAVPAAALHTPESAPTGPSIAFEGGRWFDGQNFVPAQWYAVEGRLTSTRPERIDVRIDLNGRFLLPPLADAHNHDMQNPHFGAISAIKNLRMGVFYSLQMCSTPDSRNGFAALFNHPGTIDVVHTDACISSSDGHPLGIALASDREMGLEPDINAARAGYDPIDSLAELDRRWPDIAARKPAIIKIILVNSENRQRDAADPKMFGFLGLPAELARPIVERAKAAGIRVAAHADSAADFAAAVAAGADLIAHLPGYRIAPGMKIDAYRLSDAAIAAARRQGTKVITTTAVAAYDFGPRPEHKAPIQAMQAENLWRLHSAGVQLVIGSDMVMGTAVDEILYLDALKLMPRAQLLRLATDDTPATIFPGRAIGTFAEGHEASLIAYDANPIDDLTALRRPAIRVKAGAILADPAP